MEVVSYRKTWKKKQTKIKNQTHKIASKNKTEKHMHRDIEIARFCLCKIK